MADFSDFLTRLFVFERRKDLYLCNENMLSYHEQHAFLFEMICQCAEKNPTSWRLRANLKKNARRVLSHYVLNMLNFLIRRDMYAVIQV